MGAPFACGALALKSMVPFSRGHLVLNGDALGSEGTELCRGERKREGHRDTTFGSREGRAALRVESNRTLLLDYFTGDGPILPIHANSPTSRHTIPLLIAQRPSLVVGADSSPLGLQTPKRVSHRSQG